MVLIRELQVITRETDFVTREKTKDSVFASLECLTTEKTKPMVCRHEIVRVGIVTQYSFLPFPKYNKDV